MEANFDYRRPVEIASGIFWVGFDDPASNLHCNPYIVIDHGEAAIIDAGSRSDFAIVMLKVLQTGISPGQITTLIYQHADPDLCGSMLNMIDISNNPDLKILSDPKNNTFISFYVEKEKRELIKSTSHYPEGLLVGKRRLKFFPTPYAHAAGSFVTYDEFTGTLFTSDLFGSISQKWDLYLELKEKCFTCESMDFCDSCPVKEILEFHRTIMPSEKALTHAMSVLEPLDLKLIAPQHGSIIRKRADIELLTRHLKQLKGVGIDGIIP